MNLSESGIIDLFVKWGKVFEEQAPERRKEIKPLVNKFCFDLDDLSIKAKKVAVKRVRDLFCLSSFTDSAVIEFIERNCIFFNTNGFFREEDY